MENKKWIEVFQNNNSQLSSLLFDLKIHTEKRDNEYMYLYWYKVYENIFNGNIENLTAFIQNYRINWIEDKEDLNHFIQVLSKLLILKFDNAQLLRISINILKKDYKNYFIFFQKLLQEKYWNNISQYKIWISEKIDNITKLK
jgi:hypothetical protein